MPEFVRTHRRRKAFLDQLEIGSSLSRAAQAADGQIRDFKRWKESDPDFAKDWEDAIEAGTDLLEDTAYDRAIDKSDPLMMMMLKARRPDKFDRGSKLELSGGINVEGAKAKLLNRIARIQAQGQLPGSVSEEGVQVPRDKPPEKDEVKAGRSKVPLLPSPDR